MTVGVAYSWQQKWGQCERIRATGQTEKVACREAALPCGAPFSRLCSGGVVYACQPGMKIMQCGEDLG